MTERVPAQRVLGLLSEAAKRLREQAVETASQRDRSIAELDELTETQSVVLGRLAELALPSLDLSDVMKTHSGVRERLRELAERRIRAEQELSARQRRLQRNLAERESALAAAQAGVENAAAAIAAARKELESFLANDTDYQAMQTACSQLQTRVDRDRERMKEVDLDAAEKLPDYESSTLFQYLHRRQFSTSSYSHRGLIRTLDRRVARLIDYASLKESFEFLTTVPDLMREELSKREAEVDSLVGELLEAVKSAESKFDVEPLERERVAQAQKRDRAETDRNRTLDNVQAVSDQIAELQSRENRFYREAIDELKRFLSGVETDVLERRAQSTDDYADDDAVAELRACRLRSDDAAASAASATEKAEEASHLADGVDFVLRRAGQTDLGTERAFFSPAFDIAEPLRQFEKQVIDRRRLLEILQDEADIDPTWAERAYERGSDMANSQTVQVLLGTAAAAAEPLIREALRRRIR